MPIETEIGNLADVETYEPESTAPAVEAPAAEPTPETPTASPIDYDKIGASVGDAISKAFPKPVADAPAAPKMSQEEIDKYLKKWKPDAAFMTKFGNLETQAEAIQELFERAADHAEARAQVHTYGELEKFNQRIAPQLTAFEQYQAEQREKEFNEEYPDLANPALRPVIGAVAGELFKTQKFASKKEAFAAVAKGVERVIQSHTPTFKLKGKAPVSNPNELPTQSAGTGGGGAAAAAPTGPKGPRGVELFRPVR